MVVGALVVLAVVVAIFLTLYALFGSGSDSENASGNSSDTPMNDQLADPTLGNAGSDDAASDSRGDASGSTTEEPEEVRAIYLTAANAASPEPFYKMIERTNINAVVVDVKDVTGEVMYPSDVPLANEIGATRNTLDIEALAKDLEDRDIYSIARVATFEDDILPVQRPDLAVTDSSTNAQWQNFAGNYWSDPYNREVWEYNVGVAKEAAEAGFDEVQFDYVRFPSDGPMETMTFPSETDTDNAIVDFLAYADQELEPSGVRIAADVFGLAAGDGGAGVGQDIPALAPHLDVVNPMVYPSHFPVGSYGLDNPNAFPYEVITNAVEDFEKDAKASNPDMEIRPWLQDFDYGRPAYGPSQVAAQIQATRDSSATGWLLWNPSNVYSEKALDDDGKVMSLVEEQYSGD